MTGSLGEYARRRGVAKSAVSAALKSGRIRWVVQPENGKAGVLDFEAADASWSRSTSPSQSISMQRAPEPHRHRTEPDESEDYRSARARRERAEADIAEDKARRIRGELLDAAEVRRAFAGIGRIYAAGREGIPAQLAPRLVGLTDLAEIERIVREALREADHRIASEIESRYVGFNTESVADVDDGGSAS